MSKNNKTNQPVEVGEVVRSEVALREEEMQAFWEENDIFNKSLEQPGGGDSKGDFVFFDGPPFATGLPHYGHILAGTIKDAIPRFWTMNGYRVRRNWGWDCHGLPLENIIEKRLGLATKRDVEAYGIQNFNEQAREAVMEYSDDWKKIVPRMGRFVDMENDYRTMDSTYTESVWWVFKSLHDKGLVYEGFKSMHLCPRCGTTLSNFEVNQGYKDIKDLSVTVELPLVDELDTALLVWTTTPWTLPGNMAAAVNKEFEYAVVEVKTETATKKLIVAKDRVEAVFGEREYKVVEVRKGDDLVGKKYEPPFNYIKEQVTEGVENAWQVYHADYVETGEEGTGLVHIAPAYGDDDMKLGQEHNLPIVHHVDEAGHFMDFVTDFAGQLVKPKDEPEAEINHMDADIQIIRALAASGKLFHKEKITHSYPHCWRCETPLINYATTSWFVEVTKIKNDLVVANKKVKWVPEHVGTNRFGKWLDGARDWAVSRQRYWGAPLPIWKNPESGDYKVFGSLDELKEYVPKSGNTYTLVRHGEAESNVASIISANQDNEDHLTENGKGQVEELLSSLPEAVDIIIHSGFARTKETAEIIKTKYPDAEIITDKQIGELDLADSFEGMDWKEYDNTFNGWADRFTKVIPGTENRRDVQKRMGSYLYDLEVKYQDKKILTVSHAGPLFALECAAAGKTLEEAEVYYKEDCYFGNAEARTLDFTPIPHNDNYDLDFHIPYIDKIELKEDGVSLERVPDVFDCWFESGSMPYGQHHYPFENKDNFEKKFFPANFIAEGLDQTRGWFYSMIVLGVALFGKSPYENVIVNGTMLAEDGQKMSKSLQNYPDPMDVANTAGSDAMRFYLLSSPAVKGEDLNFSEKEVLEIQRKNIGRLHNVLSMYEMFANDTEASDSSENVLDKWIVTRLNQLVKETTAGYKDYELDKATRPVTEFIDDLSVWYLRRSRDRLKGVRKSEGLLQEVASHSDERKNSDNLNSSCKEDMEDKKLALATLRHTLQTLALVMAPVTPFYAEYLWRAVKEDKDKESVHLAAWPDGGEIEEAIFETMSATREVVRSALEARTKANIKVRQPINSVYGPELPSDLKAVVLEELNAKTYEVADEVKIETSLTPELLAEGAVRELMRAVQSKRKKEKLQPQDEIELTISTDKVGQSVITAHKELLTKTVGATKLEFSATEGESVEIGEFKFNFRF